MEIRVFKLTQDDWHPPYRLDGYHRGEKSPSLVEVSFIELNYGFGRGGQTPKGFRVCVWGGDDTGMERDFVDTITGTKTQGETITANPQEEAMEMFQTVIRQEFVNMKWLKEQGFYPS